MSVIRFACRQPRLQKAKLVEVRDWLTSARSVNHSAPWPCRPHRARYRAMTGARSIFKPLGPSSVMRIRSIAIGRPRGAPSWFLIGPAFYVPIALRRLHERPTRAEVPSASWGLGSCFGLPQTGGLSRGTPTWGLTSFYLSRSRSPRWDVRLASWPPT